MFLSSSSSMALRGVPRRMSYVVLGIASVGRVVLGGLVGVLTFGEEVYCQSCGGAVSDSNEDFVVSGIGRAYCDDAECLANSAVFGDEVRNPKITGRVYNPRTVGWLHGTGKLIHYERPPEVIRSGR